MWFRLANIFVKKKPVYITVTKVLPENTVKVHFMEKSYRKQSYIFILHLFKFCQIF